MEDDLSNLPDEILQHILSFLETKEAVQTSLLSHRWRHLWRSLPILTIDSDSFRYYSTFSTFLRTLLRSRAHAPLSSCNFSFDISNPIYSSIQMCVDSRDLFEPLVARLIRHVTARGVRSLSLLFPRIVDSLPLLFSCPSLNHLHLCELVILPSFFGFSTLTALHLVKCSFLIDGVDFDPFRDFVHLADLTVCDCRIPSRVKLFRVSAPHLANLTISDMEHVRNLHPECEIVVSSAEIASFSFVRCHILRFSAAACLPCIETLDVDVLAVHYPLANSEMSRLIDMLRAFGDAKTVTLSLQTLRVLALFPDALWRPSPFTGMEVLKLKVPHRPSPIINPAEVLAFLLNGIPAIDFKEEYLKQVPGSSMGEN